MDADQVVISTASLQNKLIRQQTWSFETMTLNACSIN